MAINITEPTELVVLQSKLFRDFCELGIKAQATHDLADGFAAGHAYKAFIDSFLTEAQIDILKGDRP